MNTNNYFRIGATGSGSLTLSDGTMTVADQHVGYNTGAVGSYLMTGGTNNCQTFYLGDTAGGTGTAVVVSGLLNVVSNQIRVGSAGYGQFVHSNGTVQVKDLYVAFNVGGKGEGYQYGGSNLCNNSMVLGYSASGGGTWMMNGGYLGPIGSSLWVGGSSTGAMTVANGVVESRGGIQVGYGAGSVGALTISGAGQLFCTNSLANSPLFISRQGNGAVTNSGTIVADILTCTNAGSVLNNLSGGKLTLNRNSVIHSGITNSGSIWVKRSLRVQP